MIKRFPHGLVTTMSGGSFPILGQIEPDEDTEMSNNWMREREDTVSVMRTRCSQFDFISIRCT